MAEGNFDINQVFYKKGGRRAIRYVYLQRGSNRNDA